MDLENERWKILWATQKSQRYHRRRCAFFDRLHTFTTVSGLVAVSAAASAIGDMLPSAFSVVTSGAFVCVAAYDLVVGSSAQSRRHQELYSRFSRLEIEINNRLKPSERDLARWKNKRIEIEVDEPPIYMVIDALSENELYKIYPHLSDAGQFRVGRIKRVFGQWFRFPNFYLDSRVR